ncbi:MAG: MBL fold metallo-hydrolase [Christensenellales bacterium]
MGEISVYKLQTGPMQVNTYVVCGENKKAFIIDPGGDADKIQQTLAKAGAAPEYILLTHGHFDHIGGCDDLRKLYPELKTAIHHEDADCLTSAAANLSELSGCGIVLKAAELLLHGGDAIETAGTTVKVIFTPGHSKGSVTYQCGDLLFTGDALFRMSVGRTDLPGGNYYQMQKTLDLFTAMDKDYKIHPGHFASSTLSFEKRNNVYLRFGL